MPDVRWAPVAAPGSSLLFPLRSFTVFVVVSATLAGAAHEASDHLEEVPSGQAIDLEYLRPSVWSKDLHRQACELPAGSGSANGVCTDTLDELQDLSFCGTSIRYRACVPAENPLWPSWNATDKDQLLEELFKRMVEQRYALEMNVTPDTYVEIHYLANPECIVALRNVLCWHNFPKCDDFNRSLPLCRSSCEQYYKKCLYEPNDEDGLFDACKDEQVKQHGLFEGGSPGTDQQLADDTAVCRSTEELLDSMTVKVVEEGPWFLTWWGVSLIVLAGLLLAAACSYPQMPQRLREIIWHGIIMRIVMFPIEKWRQLPHVRGVMIIILLGVTIFALTVIGFYRVISRTLDLRRFLPDAEAEEVVNGTTTPPPSNGPPAATYVQQAQTELTEQQVRQLLGSCTCTGAAPRCAQPLLSLLCWMVSVFALMAAVPAS